MTCHAEIIDIGKIKADFEDSNKDKTSFELMELSGIDLSNTTLEKAKFMRANLPYANFEER